MTNTFIDEKALIYIKVFSTMKVFVILKQGSARIGLMFQMEFVKGTHYL